MLRFGPVPRPLTGKPRSMRISELSFYERLPMLELDDIQALLLTQGLMLCGRYSFLTFGDPGSGAGFPLPGRPSR